MQILSVLKNSRHAPDFSPRVLDTFNSSELKFLRWSTNPKDLVIFWTKENFKYYINIKLIYINLKET